MKRERRRRYVESGPNGAGWQTLRPRLHEHPEYIEAGFLRQGGESADGGLFFHTSNAIQISTNVNRKISPTERTEMPQIGEGVHLESRSETQHGVHRQG